MKINLFKFLFVLISLGLSQAQAFLTQENIEEAKTLAISPVKLEEFSSSTGTKGWLTIEEYPFEYKGNSQTFWIANTFDGFSARSHWGHIVLCKDPIDSQDDSRNLYRSTPDDFSDFNGQPILSHLKYEYIFAEQPHFILEKVTTNPNFGGNGYSRVCVKYFLEEFVSKKTEITHVFSDCRYSQPKHYFPDYGFQEGMLPGYDFKRAMHCPYYWVKEEAKDR